jgi:hypothetical protein
MNVPGAFVPVYESALQSYPDLEKESAGAYAPIGYYEWPGGAWVCDGNRVHYAGQEPQFGWTDVLHLNGDDWRAETWVVSDSLRAWLDEVREVSPDVPVYFVAAGITTDELEGPWADLVDTYWPESPLEVEGFGLRIEYLLEALDFVLAGELVGELVLMYRQGLFGLMIHTDEDVLLDFRAAVVAGHRFSQWTLIERPEQDSDGVDNPSFGGLVVPLSRSEPLIERISRYFPFPVALPYRQLAGIEGDDALYKARCVVAEHLLAYLAALALSLVGEDRRANIGIKPDEVWRNGMTGGKWRDLMLRCCQQLRLEPVSRLAAHLVGLDIGAQDRGFGKAMNLVLKARNDFHHGPSPDARACEELAAALTECFETVSFLDSFPLLRPTSLSYTRSLEKSRYRIKASMYVGDHPVHGIEDFAWHEPLVVDEFYVRVGEDQMVGLHPFVRAALCPECGALETFFIDKWPRDRGPAVLRSFEQLHELSSKDAAAEVSDYLDPTAKRPEATMRPNRAVLGASEGCQPHAGADRRVRILEGPLAGLAGVVAGGQGESTLETKVHVLGEEVTVAMDARQLQLLPPLPEEVIVDLIERVLRDAAKPLLSKEIARAVTAMSGQYVDKTTISMSINRSRKLRKILVRNEQYRWSLRNLD